MNVKMNLKIKKALLLGAALGMTLGVILTFAAASKALENKELAMTEKAEKLQKENENLQSSLKQQQSLEVGATLSQNKPDNWELVLINPRYPLDQGYNPDLVEIAPDRFVDARIVEDTKQMLSDADGAGLSLYVLSAHRSYDDQKKVFSDTMQELINQGISNFDAYEETKKSVAIPGHSEHASGLAMDITSQNYQELNDTQANTPEFQWLSVNCWKYGFILRYPQDRSNITGITYEPWHYRYVGKTAAKEITEKGITFEEYLGFK